MFMFDNLRQMASMASIMYAHKSSIPYKFLSIKVVNGTTEAVLNSFIDCTKCFPPCHKHGQRDVRGTTSLNCGTMLH